MTLSKINSNGQTNLTWRTRVDAGIDQINTNTTAIASNATNIASNDTDIATNVTNIATNATNIASNDTDIATNVTNIATNATNIASNDTDIATNVTNIATNATNIASNDTDIATNVTNIATNATNIASNDTDIATNVTNIATNATNIASNDTDIATNVTNIASNLTKINADLLQANTTVTITQSGGESTTQCVVTGHTSATFNASDYSNDAQDTIQAAINSLPKNINGYDINLVFGTESGQTITISDDIQIGDFTGGTFLITSALGTDRNNNSYTKVNKIQSSGTSITRIFEIGRCSEVHVQGLELRQTTGTGEGYVVVASSAWVDINYSVLTGNYSTHQQAMRGLLSQRGATSWFRYSWVNNVSVGIVVGNMATAAQLDAAWTGTQPVTGMQVQVGIGILNSTSIIEGSSADYSVSQGGLITNKNGLILEETILRYNKNVTIAAGSSGAEIRALIADQPKNLNGHAITFRFAAAAAGSQNTYDLGSATTAINAFTGGKIVFQAYDFTAGANVNESGTGSGTFRTKLTGSTGGYQGLIQAFNNSADFFVNDLAFEITGTNNNSEIIVSKNSTTYVDNCQFKGNETATTNANPMGVRFSRGFGIVTNSYFSDLYTGIIADEASNVYAAANNDYGNAVLNGQTAQKGSKIGLSGTKIDGSLKDLATSSGGLIIPEGGVILSDQSGSNFGSSAEAVYGQTQL